MEKNISLEYANAYYEVLEVINNVSKENYNRIPSNIILVLKIYSNKNHFFHYDFQKDFKNQNISNRAKLILAILFRDYWATDTQKERIIQKQNYNRQLLEKSKEEKYHPDYLFSNNKQKNNST